MSGAEASRLLSLSDHTMAPSPPPRGAAPSTDKRIAEIRARRLKISNMGVDMQKLTRETIRSDVTASRDMNHNVLCPGALKMQPAPPQILCNPHRQGSSPGITPQRERWYVLDFLFNNSKNKYIKYNINLYFNYFNYYVIHSIV